MRTGAKNVQVSALRYYRDKRYKIGPTIRPPVREDVWPSAGPGPFSEVLADSGEWDLGPRRSSGPKDSAAAEAAEEEPAGSGNLPFAQ